MRKLSILIALAVAVLVPAVGFTAELRGSDDSIDEHALFRVVGRMYDIDPELLEAVAEVESSGAPDAVSPKGAVGLMQLMPATAARYSVRDPRDPVENALGAARYLSELREMTLRPGVEAAEDLSAVLAAYNAGEGAVQRYGGIPPFPETQDYVGRVLYVYMLGALPPHHHAPPVPSHASKPKAVARRQSGDNAALEQLDSVRRARLAAVNQASP